MASKSYRKFMATGLSAAVVASVVAPVAGAAAYDDVKEGAWYEEAINYVTDMEYMQGTGKGFEPGADMTRAQAAQLFANILGLDGKGLKADFSDVKEGAWYYEAIAAVKEHGVMSGSGAKFNPNATLTRGEMAAIIVRAYDLKDHEGRDHSFTDIEDNMFKTEIAILADLGIVDGVSAGKFAPKADVTRAQMASFIFKTEVPEVGFPEVTAVKAVDTKTVEVTVEGAWTQEDVDALVEAGYELTVEGKASHKVGKVTVKAAEASTSADTTTLVLSEIAPELVAGEELSLAVDGEKVEGSEFKYEAPATPEVKSVSAITKTGVTVVIPAAVEDIEGFTVEVLNNEGKAVVVSPTDVVKGQTEVYLKFATALTVDPTGVWTVGTVEYDLDTLALIQDILTHSSSYNEVKLYDALLEAKIQGVTVSLLSKYAGEIVDTSADTLAEIQAAVNTVNSENVTTEQKIAVLGNIFDAKSSAVEVRSALSTSSFERINSNWVSVAGATNDYTEAINSVFAGASVTAKSHITSSNADTLYSAIQSGIDSTNATNINAYKLTVTDVAKANAYKNLIVSYVKNDGANETAKASKLAAADHTIALAELKVTTSPVEAYRLLVKFLNINSTDAHTTALLNENNKQDYYNALVVVQPSIVTNTLAADTPVGDIVDDVITVGDSAALTTALTSVQAIVDNSASAGQADNGTALSVVKSSLQKLANATSHKSGAAKFDMTIVNDERLAKYRTALKDITTSNTVAEVTTAVRTVNDNASLTVYLNTVSTSKDVNAVTAALTNLANVKKADSTLGAKATAYLNTNSAVKAELSDIIVTELHSSTSVITPTDTVDGILTVDEIFGATKIWENNSASAGLDVNLYDGAVAAHTAKVTAFQAVGDLGATTPPTATEIVDAIDGFVSSTHAWNSLDASKQLLVAEAFLAHNVNYTDNGVAKTRKLNFADAGADEISTIAKGYEWVNKFITEVTAN